MLLSFCLKLRLTLLAVQPRRRQLRLELADQCLSLRGGLRERLDLRLLLPILSCQLLELHATFPGFADARVLLGELVDLRAHPGRGPAQEGGCCGALGGALTSASSELRRVCDLVSRFRERMLSSSRNLGRSSGGGESDVAAEGAAAAGGATTEGAGAAADAEGAAAMGNFRPLVFTPSRIASGTRCG